MGSARQRHAEIAGLGLAGLSAACALAKAGWSVRIHERSPSVRATGAGIYVAENSLKVLDTLGASEEVLSGAYLIRERHTRDRNNFTVAIDEYPSDQDFRVYFLRRETLVHALLNVALSLGVEVRYSSFAVKADPDGTLTLEDGEEFKADLVIGADGVHSCIRDSLGLPYVRRTLSQGAHRAVCRRLPDNHLIPPRSFAEWWAGRRRFFYAPISDDLVYLVLIAQTSDTLGAMNPLETETWRKSFPFVADVIDQIDDPVPFLPFLQIQAKRWTVGKAAVLGDAVHAMAPNLGQGGGTAMMNGLGLAFNVNRPGISVEEGLRLWEQRHRGIVDKAQFLSRLYGTFAEWPEVPRRAALWFCSKSKWITNQRLATANYVPDGVGTPPPSLTSIPRYDR